MNVLHHVQVLKINEDSASILHDFLDGRKRITASRFEDQYDFLDGRKRIPASRFEDQYVKSERWKPKQQ